MGKKNKQSGLGRTIIKDRFGKTNKPSSDTFLHTSELQDGYDWGRLNLQSVTEQNNLEDFLTTAELAGTEFTAEKLNIQFVSQDTGGLPRAEEVKIIHGLHKENEKLLRIPRRPHWTKEMSASEVDQNERMAFLEWRRSLALLQEDERIVMTPYEKNLDFWRQLWRVIERSDLVVQIVDARNPLLFYCADLETYVSEIDPSKVCLLLINKADFLNQQQRESWASYFTERGIRIAFWSARAETERQENMDTGASKEDELDGADSGSEGEKLEKEGSEKDNNSTGNAGEEIDIDTSEAGLDEHNDTEEEISEDCDNDADSDIDENREGNDDTDTDIREHGAGKERDDAGTTDTNRKFDNDFESKPTVVKTMCECEKLTQDTDNTKSTEFDEALASGSKTGLPNKCAVCVRMQALRIRNTAYVYTGPELLELFRGLHHSVSAQELTTVGMVGYPNVGKSSTINAILKMKKVPVSATPGRTKHFQTLYVDATLMLCDCPGLVFPSFVTTKADLVVAGILPIDQMRDCMQPTALLCGHIARWRLEQVYGVNIPAPGEGEDPERAPTPYELLNTYAGMRGFMTARGQPDAPRASRYILKDYVNGKLLYCHPPPGMDPVEFNDKSSGEPSNIHSSLPVESGAQLSSDVPVPSKIDQEFFRKGSSTIHTKTSRGNSGAQTLEGSSLDGKPWKKHNNKKKKEKLRRVYGYLDK